MDTTSSTAMVHAFAALGFGSSFFHASQTISGHRADATLIELIAFLMHQVIAKGIASAEWLPIEDYSQLMDLQATPRAKTAVETAF